jgi:hypothetical protein
MGISEWSARIQIKLKGTDRIRIRIRVKGRIRIRVKVESRIRIRNTADPGTVPKPEWFIRIRPAEKVSNPTRIRIRDNDNR